MSAGLGNPDYQLNDMEARSDDPYARAKYDIILNWLAPYSNLKILNVGCGSGELTLALAAKGHEVVGIDPNEKYIAMLEREVKRQNAAGCSFQVSSIEDFNPGRTFDAIVTTDVLEHIADDRNAVEKMMSLLEPEGILVATVPAGQWLFGYHDRMLQHFRRYSAGSLKKLLSPHLEVKEVRYFGFLLIPVCILYSQILQRYYPIPKPGQKSSSLKSAILSLIMDIEKAVRFPLGTSLLAFGARRPHA